jgi:hypothetical protein
MLNIINVDYKWNGQLQKRTSTDYIIYHHAEWKECTVHDIHALHQNDSGWIGIGYNFVIYKDGTIYTGRPIDMCDADAYGYNCNSLSICFVGDFNVEHMTETQIDSGIWLTKYLLNKYPTIKRLFRHKDVNVTECPGKNFDDRIILEGSKTGMNINNASEALEVLKNAGVVNSPEYWLKVADVVRNFEQLLINVAKYVDEHK